MKTPSRQPAHMCACGWIHRLGSPTTCPLAAPTTAPLATAPLDSGNEQGRSETSVTLKGSDANRKQQPSYRWSILKTQARRRSIPCDVQFEEFVALIKQPCHYCGDGITERFRGLDRVDNNRGYTSANVVPCCPVCNYMKAKLTRSFFLAHVRKIASHRIE